MIKGTGIDILEFTRLHQQKEKNHRLAKRILTEQEFKRYVQLNGNRQIEFLGGRFAAKEAFAKALGTGIGKAFSWKDISILNNDQGRPIVHTQITRDPIHLSISHSENYVVASIIIESLSS